MGHCVMGNKSSGIRGVLPWREIHLLFPPYSYVETYGNIIPVIIQMFHKALQSRKSKVWGQILNMISWKDLFIDLFIYIHTTYIIDTMIL